MAKQEKGRAPYFLFDPQSWNGSTKIRSMEADQCGWYIQLLADAWLSKDVPQATLPNDDALLKQQSRYNKSVKHDKNLFDDIKYQLDLAINVMGNDVTPDKVRALIGSLMDNLWVRHLEKFEERWQTVISQFKVSPDMPNLLYNPRQLAELRQWLDSYRRKIDGGIKGATNRWGTGETVEPSVAKQLLDPDLVEPHPLLNGSPIGQVDISLGQHGNIKNNTKSTSLSQNDNSVPKSSEASTLPTASMASTVKKTLLRKKPETLFDEDRFRITDKMAIYLQAKYPEFVLGDFEYLTDKFKNAYHGKVYTSWSRTFYNFVGNQVVLYNYKPGAFNWRTDSGTSQRATMAGAADRNAERDRQNAELTQRLLQSDNQRVDTEDSEALPLTSSDIRDPT